MNAPYYVFAKELFPKAKLIVDHFHLSQLIVRSLSQTRIQLMNRFKTSCPESQKTQWCFSLFEKRTYAHTSSIYRYSIEIHRMNGTLKILINGLVLACAPSHTGLVCSSLRNNVSTHTTLVKLLTTDWYSIAYAISVPYYSRKLMNSQRYQQSATILAMTKNKQLPKKAAAKMTYFTKF